jgi:GntR family transcriptional regulator/MocR family aminotransferase
MVWRFHEIIDFEMESKKTRYSVFENQLCNYLNAKGTSHKTKKRHQHKKYRNEFVHHIATLIRPKDVVLVGI